MSRNFGQIAAILAIASLLGCNAHINNDAGPVEPSNTGTAVVMVNDCLLPSVIDGVQACVAYARCCGFNVDVPADSCTYSSDAGVGTCACSNSESEKVRCDDTSRGVACTCY